MENKEKKEKTAADVKSKVLWSVLFLAIVGVTIWTITYQNDAFSFEVFLRYLKGTSPGWLAAAVLCAFGFVFFEAGAIRASCRILGYSHNHRSGMVYAAADIYFSAITPSASGGQPVCAWFMMKDGIPGTVTAAALVANLMMYSFAILLIGLVVFALAFPIFMGMSVFAKVLILGGYLVQVLLAVLFLLLIKDEKLVSGISLSVIGFLGKRKLLRHAEEKKEKTRQKMEEYAACAVLFQKNKAGMLKVFFWNLLQRISYICVTMFAFLAAGGTLKSALPIWAVQGYSVIGSNCVPIPGAVGAADYLMLDGFKLFMSAQKAANLELLSRSLSFYFCMIFCGCLVLVSYLVRKRRNYVRYL